MIKLSPVLVTSSFPLLVFTPNWVWFRLLTRLCGGGTGGGSLLLLRDRITLKVMGQPASRGCEARNYKGNLTSVFSPSYLS